MTYRGGNQSRRDKEPVANASSHLYNIASTTTKEIDQEVLNKIKIVKDHVPGWDDDDILRVLADSSYNENLAINNILDGFAVKSSSKWTTTSSKKTKTTKKKTAGDKTVSDKGKGKGKGKVNNFRQPSAPVPAHMAKFAPGEGSARPPKNKPAPAPVVHVDGFIQSVKRTYHTGGTCPSMADIVAGSLKNRPSTSADVSVSEKSETICISTTTTTENQNDSWTKNNFTDSWKNTVEQDKSPELSSDSFTSEQSEKVDTFAINSEPVEIATPHQNVSSHSTPLSASPAIANHSDAISAVQLPSAPVVLPGGVLSGEQIQLQLQFGNLGFGSNSTEPSGISALSQETTTEKADQLPHPQEQSEAPSANVNEGSNSTNNESETTGTRAGMLENIVSPSNSSLSTNSTDAENQLHMPQYGYLPNPYMAGMHFPYDSSVENADMARMNQGRPMFFDPASFPVSQNNNTRSDSSASTSSSNGFSMSKDSSSKFDAIGKGHSKANHVHGQPQSSQVSGLSGAAALAANSVQAPGAGGLMAGHTQQQYMNSSQFSAMYTYPYMNQFPSAYQAGPNAANQFPFRSMPGYFKQAGPPNPYSNLHAPGLNTNYPNASYTPDEMNGDYSKAYGMPPQHNVPFAGNFVHDVSKGPMSHHNNSNSSPSTGVKSFTSSSAASDHAPHSSFKNQKSEYNKYNNVRDSSSHNNSYYGSNMGNAPGFNQGGAAFPHFVQPHLVMQPQSFQHHHRNAYN